MSPGYYCLRKLVPKATHKMLLKSYEDDIEQISLGKNNHNIFFGDFYRHQPLKREKVGPTFPSLCNERKFHCVKGLFGP